MTTEEKAMILVGYEIDTPRNLMRLEARDEYDNLMSMAEWKDQQHAKITSKIIEEESNASFESGFAEGERKTEARFREKLEQMMKVAYFDKEVYKHIINELFGEE